VKVALIGNPRSRKNVLDPGALDRFGSILGGAGTLYVPQSLEELAEIARALGADPPDVLALHGGDGTLHRVFTALVPHFSGPIPPVVVLRGGTMNIVATSVGMRLRPDRALELALGRRESRVVRRSLLRVGGEQYGFLFGNGIIARFLELYYQKPSPTPWDAGWLLAWGAASALVGGPLIRQLTRRFDGTAVVDGEAWPETSWVGVAAGTVEQIGLGFTPFYLAGSHPGKMHVVGVGGTVAELARELPRVRLGRPLRGPHHHSAAANDLLLRGTESFGYMVDGDFHVGAEELRLSIGPPVDFLVPE
jgi:diacylglycerol kinase family enzyme